MLGSVGLGLFQPQVPAGRGRAALSFSWKKLTAVAAGARRPVGTATKL